MVLHYFKQFTHNFVCHGLMGLFPCRFTIWLHDVNAKWAFKPNDKDEKTGVNDG